MRPRTVAQSRKPTSASPYSITLNVTLNLRGHLIEPDHARKPAYLTLLVAAKPHQKRHRRPDQFPHHRAIDIDVQLGARGMLGAAQLRAYDFAKRGFDGRPIFNLIRREAQPTS